MAPKDNKERVEDLARAGEGMQSVETAAKLHGITKAELCTPANLQAAERRSIERERDGSFVREKALALVPRALEILESALGVPGASATLALKVGEFAHKVSGIAEDRAFAQKAELARQAPVAAGFSIQITFPPGFGPAQAQADKMRTLEAAPTVAIPMVGLGEAPAYIQPATNGDLTGGFDDVD